MSNTAAHKLVAHAFLKFPTELMRSGKPIIVDHLNEKKEQNICSNLEYVSLEDNCTRSTGKPIQAHYKANGAFYKSWVSQGAASRELNMPYATLARNMRLGRIYQVTLPGTDQVILLKRA